MNELSSIAELKEVVAQQSAQITLLTEQTTTLTEQNALLTEQNALLTEQNTLLSLRIEELEQRINKNSSNSDKPPSSDGLSKKPAFPRKPGLRKSGGQSGHRGRTLKMVAIADHYELHPVKASQCDCGCKLAGIQASDYWDKRQVFDLPPTILQVSEHRVESKTCPNCQRVHLGEFPLGVNAPVQYGDRVRSLAVLLNVEQSLPLARVQELFAGLTGYEINESTVHSAVERMYEQLEEEEKIIHQEVLKSDVAHSDETGGRIAGKLHWVHVFSSLLHTLYIVSDQRGGEVIKGPDSHLANYKGRLIHDCLNSYLAMTGLMSHGLCNAHILRELTALMELPKALTWPAKMHELLLEYYLASDCAKGVASQATLEQLDEKYADVLEQADKEEPPPIQGKRGRPKKSKGRNLMERLKEHQEAVLAFSRCAEVHFTNNLGERDLRPWKTKLKVSGCFRTLAGALHYARIKGFCSTVKKNGLVVFEQLLAAQKGQSFLRLT
ncbi:MAG: IS66 family transposase [Chloroflexia bacterium]|nr:IS66 family transposase [Chloroflexia bacterium]